MIREVMHVDGVEWDEGRSKVGAMAREMRDGNGVSDFPYKLGIGVSLLSGALSIPMVFDLNTALWFNEAYVTTDVPGAEGQPSGPPI